MMAEWWTYSPGDFLMFSARTYYRLFELQNKALWPAHGIALAAGVAILLLLRRADGRAGRLAAAFVGSAWLVVAWAYFGSRYAEIHSAGRYFAAAFALQGVALFWVGVGRAGFALAAPTSFRGRMGRGLLVFAIFLQPLIGLAVGRPLGQAEVFGFMPDPTAVATVGLLLVPARSPWWLWVIPVGWSLFSGMTLWTLHAPDAVVLPGLVFAALGVALRRPRND